MLNAIHQVDGNYRSNSASLKLHQSRCFRIRSKLRFVRSLTSSGKFFRIFCFLVLNRLRSGVSRLVPESVLAPVIDLLDLPVALGVLKGQKMFLKDNARFFFNFMRHHEVETILGLETTTFKFASVLTPSW